MKTVFKILVTFLLLSTIWLCFSCGARKTSKQSSKEEIKTEVTDNSVVEKQSESNVKTTTTVKTDDKNQTVIEETVIEPADKNKESFIIEKDGTKTVLNNVKKTTTKTIKINNTQTQSFGNSEQVQKEASKELKVIKQVNTYKKENSSKEVKKEQFNPFNLLWFIIPIALIWFLYRQYKKLPLFPKF